MTLEDQVVRSIIAGGNNPPGRTLVLNLDQCVSVAGPTAAAYVGTVETTARLFLKASNTLQHAQRDTTATVDSHGHAAVYYLFPVAMLPALLQWQFNVSQHGGAVPNTWTGLDGNPQ